MADKQNLAKKIDLNTKQDILIAGQNITIAADGKTISAANPTSVTVTPVYQAGTLVAAIIVNGNTTNIYAPAQHGDNANQNLALPFNTSQTYEVGDFVIYEENLYQCITAISTPAAWDSTKWTRALITDVMGQGSGGDYANQNIANTYSTASTYDVGDYVIYNGLLYKCVTAVTTPGSWNATYWEHCVVTDEMGGGLDLPDNWSLDEEALTVMALDNDLNELGWKVEDDTYYFDTAASFSLGDRTYTKDNAKPALGGVIGQPNGSGNRSIVLVSTVADATYFSWNNTAYNFDYNGTTWYYCGGNYAYYGSPASGIEIIPDDTLTLEQAAKYLIDQSVVSFTDNRFTTMNQPGSGTLFAGGGEESDLSDATFKVTSDGGVYGTEFYKNGVPIGGGGGNVDDVYVNGQSVLDANKIAQITNYVELTQAEYDALPASKESNNVLYCIKDQATADTTVAPIIYSEEEREVGVWTDGKPLYQKSVNIGKITQTGERTYTIGIKNVDTIVAYSILPLERSGDTGLYAIDNYNNSWGGGSYTAYTFKKDSTAGLQIILYSGYYTSLNDIYTTVQYTKTTDTPGSGKYAPSGVPAVHYSENEQVVGTDTDGSTVYEITYIGDMNIPIQTWGGTGIYVSGNLISVDGYITRDGEPIPIGNFGTTVASTWILRDGEIKVQMTEYNTGEIYKLKRMTIRYTKTTS